MNLLVVIVLLGYVFLIYKQHANYEKEAGGNDSHNIDQPLVTFNFFTFYTKANLLRAYIYLGLELMRKDRGDLRQQQNFFLVLLTRRFKGYDRREITKVYLKIMRHQSRVDLNSVCDWVKKHSALEEKENMLNLLCDMVYHNDLTTHSEMKYLYHIASKIGVPIEVVRSIISIRQERIDRQRTQASSPRVNQNAYLIRQKLHTLGLSGKPNAEDLKKAYRDLAKKHHPDRFHNKSEEEKQAAHERFIAINKAYEFLISRY